MLRAVGQKSRWQSAAARVVRHRSSGACGRRELFQPASQSLQLAKRVGEIIGARRAACVPDALEASGQRGKRLAARSPGGWVRRTGLTERAEIFAGGPCAVSG